MKLLFCPRCGDVRKLRLRRVRCECGHVSGRYLSDGAHAEVSADAHVIGIGNGSVAAALRGRTQRLDAWVFDRDSAERLRWVP